MLFNSFSFLLLFLPVTYAVFWLLHSRQQRYIWLTITGYVFYGAWNWKFCGLMAFSTVVSFTAGLLMLRWDEHPMRRRACLVVPIVIDLLLLGFFKYFNFAVSTASGAAALAGFSWHPKTLNIVLPIGISFYTFHTISYIVDSYRRVITPTRNLFQFSCYVSLFSQLVAGPIVRFREVESDLEGLDRAKRGALDSEGWSYFIIGLAQKVLLADLIAAVIDPALANWSRLSTGQAWACTLGYSYQLYFDFSGYSNMAVGLGRLFGIRIPQNFRSPYQADGIADFWRRWHISLSSCLRDYVYIPLGGKAGQSWLVYRNLLLTMLIGGLWHGASWNFIVWGAYHGLLLSAHRALGETRWHLLPKLARQALTFLSVVVGWVLFRATDLPMAGGLLRTMFSFHPEGAMACLATLACLIAVAALFAHKGRNTFEIAHSWNQTQSIVLALLFVICLCKAYLVPASPFLYFQF